MKKLNIGESGVLFKYQYNGLLPGSVEILLLKKVNSTNGNCPLGSGKSEIKSHPSGNFPMGLTLFFS
jgi:hypothetical protein